MKNTSFLGRVFVCLTNRAYQIEHRVMGLPVGLEGGLKVIGWNHKVP